QSKCGWSPFTDMQLTGKPMGTIIRGHRVMWEDELCGAPIGEPIRFDATG
ncbi:MAG: dihydroorotase, partial [Sphingomonadales bacterium]|nr:dihydroorotase [Sphingomonadales bacterium]